VRPDCVVVPSPLLDDNLGFFQAVEDLSIEELKLPGGAGAPPGDNTILCQELADGAGSAGRVGLAARPPDEGTGAKKLKDTAPELDRKRGPAP
jgi:hypothetical protein